MKRMKLCLLLPDAGSICRTAKGEIDTAREACEREHEKTVCSTGVETF